MGDYETPGFYHAKMRRARKVHRCAECGRVIALGELYEHVTGKWDGMVDTFKTCEHCKVLREGAFRATEADEWLHGGLHAELDELWGFGWKRLREEMRRKWTRPGGELMRLDWVKRRVEALVASAMAEAQRAREMARMEREKRGDSVGRLVS